MTAVPASRPRTRARLIERTLKSARRLVAEAQHVVGELPPDLTLAQLRGVYALVGARSQSVTGLAEDLGISLPAPLAIGHDGEGEGGVRSAEEPAQGAPGEAADGPTGDAPADTAAPRGLDVAQEARPEVEPAADAAQRDPPATWHACLPASFSQSEATIRRQPGPASAS